MALDGVVLRPALKAIILALLPGFEDESSEEAERADALLARFKTVTGGAHALAVDNAEASSEQFFWQCLFLASITSPSRRQGALAFLSRHLPKLGNGLFMPQTIRYDSSKAKDTEYSEASSIDTEAVTTPEPGLLIRCFESGLRDDQVLIQRGFLDLLVTHLPLHSAVLRSKVTPEDVERLVAAAASVVSRRDMSLNRRLWTWLLGQENSVDLQNGTPSSADSPVLSENNFSLPLRSHDQSWYFRRYALEPLTCSILKIIETGSVAPLDRARPFRICLSLMDKSEIGELIIPRVFLPLLNSAYQYQKLAPSRESFEEVLRSANVFFDGVESGLIWGEVFKVLDRSFQGSARSNEAQSQIDLILFLVTKFNVREEEMQTVHMPLITLMLVIYLRKSMQGTINDQVAKPAVIYSTALRIAVFLQDLVPKRAYAASLASEKIVLLEESSELVYISQSFLNDIHEFYSHYPRSIKLANALSTSPKIGEALLKDTTSLILQSLETESYARHIDLELSLFDMVIQKVPGLKHLEEEKFISALHNASDRMNVTDEGRFFMTSIISVVSVLDTVCTAFPTVSWLSNYKMRQLIPKIVSKLWSGLSPSKPECNVEAARCIWRLQAVLSCTKMIEGMLATLLSSNCRDTLCVSKVENARRFVVLWTHSATSSGNLQSSRSGTARRQSQKSEKTTDLCAPAMVLLGRPLLLLLDSLLDTKTDLSIFVTSWLQSLPDSRE